MWASLEKSRDAGIQHEQQEHLDEEGKGTGASLLVTRRKRSRSFHTTGAKRAHGWGGERNSLQTRICTPKTDNKLELKHIYHNAYSKNTIFLYREGVESRVTWKWERLGVQHARKWGGASMGNRIHSFEPFKLITPLNACTLNKIPAFVQVTIGKVTAGLELSLHTRAMCEQCIVPWMGWGKISTSLIGGSNMQTTAIWITEGKSKVSGEMTS